MRSIQRASADIAGQMAKDWLFGTGGGGYGGLQGGALSTGLSWLSSGISGLFGGGDMGFGSSSAINTYGGGSFMARAKGGPIDPRKLYIVGEEGPEIFYSGDKSGTVIPADQTRDIFQSFNVSKDSEKPALFRDQPGKDSDGPPMVSADQIHNIINNFPMLSGTSRAGAVIANDPMQNIFQNFNMPTTSARPAAGPGRSGDITLNVPVTVNAGGDIPSQARLSGRLQEAVENTVMRIIREEIR